MKKNIVFLCLMFISRDFFASHTYVVPEIFQGYHKTNEILMKNGVLFVIYQKETDQSGKIAICMRTHYPDGAIIVERYTGPHGFMPDGSQTQVDGRTGMRSWPKFKHERYS